MLKFIKLLAGLFLLPLCWAASRVLYHLLVSVGDGAFAWSLPAGFVLAVVGFFLLPPAFRTYVLGHELTHAVWGVLMGAKVGRIKVGQQGGHVELSKSNFLISLAPYFFPFYTAIVVLIWFGLSFFFDVAAYQLWWMGAVGFTWGFHVTFTLYMLSQRQPDILENGRVFSYVVIYLANLCFVSLWLVAMGAPDLSGLKVLFLEETSVVYSILCDAATSVFLYAQRAIVGNNSAFLQ
jgi:hypothetical protein